MHCVAVTSVRGGAGKSTVAVNLAARLAAHGDTLLIDLDPKSDCAVFLAVPHDAIRAGSNDILSGEAARRQLRREGLAWPVQKRLDLIPAAPSLSFADAGDSDAADPGRLAAWLNHCGRKYDFVVLDVPTANHRAMAAALEVATAVLIPAVPDFPTLSGIERDLAAARAAAQNTGRSLPVRVVGVMHDVRSRFSREMVLGFRQRLAENYLQTIIHASVKCREAASFGQPVSVYDPSCPASQEFRALAEELLDPRTGIVSAEEHAQAACNPRLRLVDVPSGHVAIPIYGLAPRNHCPVRRPTEHHEPPAPIRLPGRALQLVPASDD